MLEEKTYTIEELSDIIGTSGKEATNRKLKGYKIDYKSEGRGNKLVYTITNITDRFKVFCVFDLGFSPQTDFRKLRDFLFYLLGNDDFNWRPMEMMEEYLLIRGKGISRQTISKYIERLKSLDLFAEISDYVYYRVYKYFGVQKHEIVTKEEYSKAWRLYWDKRAHGYDSRAAYSCMYTAFGGVPRRHAILAKSAFCLDQYNLLTELIAESYLLENGG